MTKQTHFQPMFSIKSWNKIKQPSPKNCGINSSSHCPSLYVEEKMFCKQKQWAREKQESN